MGSLYTLNMLKSQNEIENENNYHPLNMDTYNSLNMLLLDNENENNYYPLNMNTYNTIQGLMNDLLNKPGIAPYI